MGPKISQTYNMTLATVSHTKGPISARPMPFRHSSDPTAPLHDLSYMIGPTMVATHSFEDAPHLDVIVVPGGAGDFSLVEANNRDIENFIATRFDAADYVLSV